MKNLTQIKTNSKKGYCDLRTGEWNETIRDCIASFKREYKQDKFIQIYVPYTLFKICMKFHNLQIFKDWCAYGHLRLIYRINAMVYNRFRISFFPEQWDEIDEAYANTDFTKS